MSGFFPRVERDPERSDPSERAEQVLARLELTINQRLVGLLHGDYRGLVPGLGSEVGEARTYQLGDDVRRIDWNVTARMSDTYVRETIADRELETWAIVDLSPSLDFGTAICEKRDLALASVAAVGFLAARMGNRFGMMVLHPQSNRILPAQGGRRNIMSLLRILMTAPRAREGSADLGDGIKRLAAFHRRRGLAVIVSDFMGPREWERDLPRLTLHHDVLAVEVIDPRELELPDVGTLQVVDTETGAVREVHTGSRKLRQRYAEAAAAQRAATARALRDAGTDHLVLRTDRDWLEDLVDFVVARRLRIRGRARRAFA